MLTRRTRIGLWTASLLTGFVGVVNLLSAVTPALPERRLWIQAFFPFSICAGGHFFSAIVGFMLLTLAANLLRRKRVAWLLAVGLLISSTILHLIKGFDYEESLLSGALLVQLLAMRGAFTAKSDRPSIAQGIRVLLGAMLFTLAYGTAGFFILDGRYNINGQPINFDFGQAVLQTLAMFFTADNAGLEPKTRFAIFFADSIYAVGGVTLSYALILLLRPVLLRETATPSEKSKAKEIVEQYGQVTLARLALLEDKSYYFSPSGQTAIAYVPKGRAAISLGDPIGPPEDIKEAILSFQLFCDRNDWQPAFYQTLPDNLDIYKSLGFRALQIGQAAILELKSFQLKGKANQNLRTAINRLTKSGHQVTFYEPPLSNALLRDMKMVSDEWLPAVQGAEKHFSVGWFDEDYLRANRAAALYDIAGKMLAFVNIIEAGKERKIGVDLMRRCNQVENGSMEYLFASILLHFQSLGYEEFDLGLSALVRVGELEKNQRFEAVLNYLYKHLNQFYSFQGLHTFKSKFQPQWQPRYLVYPGLSKLPEVVVALIRVDSGDRLLDYLKLGE